MKKSWEVWGRLKRWLPETFLLLCLALMVPAWRPIQVRYDNLDGGWQAVLHHFVNTPMLFGEDLVYTMGPLGFLRSPVFHPSTYPCLLLWGGGLALALTAAWSLVFERSPTRIRVVSFVFFATLPILSAGQSGDLLFPLLGSFLFFQVIRSCVRFSLREAWIAVVLGCGTWILFTHLVVIVVIMASVVALCLVRFRRVPVSVWFWGFTLVVVWFSTGQTLGNLPSYLASGFELASAYAEVMSMSGPGWEPASILALASVCVVLTAYRGIPGAKWEALCLVAASCFLFYVAFKSGFVRHHRPRITLTSVTLLSLLLGYWAATEGIVGVALARRGRIATWWVLVASVCVSIVFLGLGVSQIPSYLEQRVKQYNFHWRGVRLLATDFQSYRVRDERKRFTVRKEFPLPPVRDRVDWFGNRIGLAIAHDLTLAPRPVFQSFAAYTPELAEVNASYYRSSAAPSVVLAEIHPFARYPVTLLDARAFLELRSNYRVSGRTDAVLILKRKNRTPVRRELIRELDVPMGRFVAIPNTQDSSALWVEIDVSKTWWGRAIAVLWKPSRQFLDVRFADGGHKAYRIASKPASGGFLLSPLLADATHLQIFLEGREVPPDLKVSELRIREDPHSLFSHYRRGRIRLHRLSWEVAK